MDQYHLVPASQIPANASHYEWRRGMPDPVAMQTMWASWAAASIVAAASSGAIFVGILSSPKARASSFNLYLVMLAVPDFVFSSSCTVTCTLNAFNRFYTSVQMCNGQSWYLTFGIAGSFWLNAAAAAEVHILLKHTKSLAVYRPPSRRAVLARCLVILALCAVVSTWHLWGIFPFEANPMHGVACIAGDHDRPATFFFWLAYIPIIAGFPCAYAGYVAIDCWRRSLLSLVKVTSGSQVSNPVLARPASESFCEESVTVEDLQQERHARRTRQSRQLCLYFGRIFVSVLVMWFPFLLFFLIFPMRSAWGIWAGGLWGHLQGFVSAIMCLTKPDVLEAVLALFRCRYCRGEDGNTSASVQLSTFCSTNKIGSGATTGAGENRRAYDACAVGNVMRTDMERTFEASVSEAHGTAEQDLVPEMLPSSVAIVQ